MHVSVHPTGKSVCMAIMAMCDAGRALRVTGATGLQLTAALL